MPSKDRLHAWGVVTDDGCGLRGLEQETHADLFFSCVLQANGSISRAGLSLQDEVAWIGQHMALLSHLCAIIFFQGKGWAGFLGPEKAFLAVSYPKITIPG